MTQSLEANVVLTPSLQSHYYHPRKCKSCVILTFRCMKWGKLGKNLTIIKLSQSHQWVTGTLNKIHILFLCKSVCNTSTAKHTCSKSSPSRICIPSPCFAALQFSWMPFISGLVELEDFNATRTKKEKSWVIFEQLTRNWGDDELFCVRKNCILKMLTKST